MNDTLQKSGYNKKLIIIIVIFVVLAILLFSIFKKTRYDYVIVGSGLYGATFAYFAKQHGKKVLLLDVRNVTGGNLYCDNYEGIHVHKYGPHIFHTDNKKVWDFVNSIVEFTPFMLNIIANYNNSLYNLPFNMYTFHQIWGVKTPEEAKAKIESQKYKGEVHNLEEQALSLVGKDIYEKLIKGYTEKQWGRDAKDLPASIIKRLPVRYEYNNNYYYDRYQGIPVGGYNAFINKLIEGCDVILNVNYNKDKEKYKKMGDTVVYSGKIDEYFDYKYGMLEYRTVYFKNEKYDKKSYQGNVLINYPDKNVPYTRITEHKFFEPYRKEIIDKEKTIISKEFSVEWKPGMEGYYPVNDQKNNELFKKYKELANKEKNVLFGGRLADYKYYDMKDVIENVFKFWNY